MYKVPFVPGKFIVFENKHNARPADFTCGRQTSVTFDFDVKNKLVAFNRTLKWTLLVDTRSLANGKVGRSYTVTQ